MDWIQRCFLITVVAVSVITISCTASPCVQREISKDHVVCVCNATYCDTLPKDISVPEGQFVMYASTKAGLRFENTEGFIESYHTSRDEIQFNVDPSSKQQSILGFGGAFTDAVGINILTLSEAAQDNLLSSYFSPEGMELNMGRVPIAGSDFSTHPYTYDDEPNDDDLSKFSLTSEDLQYKIPLIKRAMAMSKKPLKLLSAAWSSPTWMKTNDAITGFAFLKEEYYQTWADYHIKFFDAYKEHGLDFWATSTGNEPFNGVVPLVKFNSLGWSPKSQAKWVAENLGPALNRSKHSNTKILALDDQRLLLPWWVDKMMENTEAAKYISGIAVHWYYDKVLPSAILTRTHNNFPDKFLIATEACRGERPWDYPKVILGSWSRAQDYISDIIEDMNHWVAGWVDWNLALDLQGGPNWVSNFVDAAIIVNKTADEFYKQPIYYAMAHFTKFVPEESYHISIEPQSQNGIHVSAFSTPSGKTVVVLYNKKSSDTKVTVKDSEKGLISITLLKNSFNTLVY